MSKEVEVTSLPRCDFCGEEARYDHKTRMGPWANSCEAHFASHGVGLGTGVGQKLLERKDG